MYYNRSMISQRSTNARTTKRPRNCITNSVRIQYAIITYIFNYYETAKTNNVHVTATFTDKDFTMLQARLKTLRFVSGSYQLAVAATTECPIEGGTTAQYGTERDSNILACE